MTYKVGDIVVYKIGQQEFIARIEEVGLIEGDGMETESLTYVRVDGTLCDQDDIDRMATPDEVKIWEKEAIAESIVYDD